MQPSYVSNAEPVNIIDMTDDEIVAIAHPMWDELVKYSNKGKYGKFIRKFSITCCSA